jgi:hypothetical protein
MDQIHKRFTIEQVKFLLQGYTQGTIGRTEVEGMLQINKTRFFALVKEYRRDPAGFSITYERKTHARLSSEVEAAMAKELLREKELVENPELPITSYNYSAIQDRLEKKASRFLPPRSPNERKSWVAICHAPRRRPMTVRLSLPPSGLWYNMMLPRICGRHLQKRNGL